MQELQAQLQVDLGRLEGRNEQDPRLVQLRMHSSDLAVTYIHAKGVFIDFVTEVLRSPVQQPQNSWIENPFAKKMSLKFELDEFQFEQVTDQIKSSVVAVNDEELSTKFLDLLVYLYSQLRFDHLDLIQNFKCPFLKPHLLSKLSPDNQIHVFRILLRNFEQLQDFQSCYEVAARITAVDQSALNEQGQYLTRLQDVLPLLERQFYNSQSLIYLQKAKAQDKRQFRQTLIEQNLKTQLLKNQALDLQIFIFDFLSLHGGAKDAELLQRRSFSQSELKQLVQKHAIKEAIIFQLHQKEQSVKIVN